MTGKIRKGTTLVLLIVLFAFTIQAQSEYDLNGFTLDAGTPTVGAAASEGAIFSGSNLFAQDQAGLQADFSSGIAAQQMVPNLATQQAVPNLAAQQNVAGTGLQNNLLRSENTHVIRWSGTELTVQVDGETATSGVTPIEKNSNIVVAVNPASNKVVINCWAEYSIEYDVDGRTEQNQENIKLISLEGLYYLRIDEKLTSDVIIHVDVQTSYPLWIAGEVVTDSNRNDIGERGGSVSFNPERNILFLNNAVIEGSIVSKMPLTILFAGDNVVSAKAGTNYGISSSENLSISASSSGDTLTVTAPVADKSCAIAVENADLTIWNGTNVTAISQGGVELSAGVFASGTVEVNGMLSAAGGSAAKSCGICSNNLTIKNISSGEGGAVAAAGGECYSGGSSAGVLATGNVTVEYQAKLVAAGKAAAGGSYGIRTGGNFTNSGAAECSAGNGGGESIGLSAGTTVSNTGTLSTTGGTSSGGASRGLSANSLQVSGGAVDAHAVAGAAGSTGIFAATVISGGEVIAEGAGGAFSAMPSFSGYSPVIRVSDLSSDAFEADSAVASNYLRKYVYITSRIVSSAPTELTIYVGETHTLSASVPEGYFLRWYGSNNMVAWVDEMLGTVTGRSPGSLMATVKVYNPSGGQVSEASCMVTVREKETVPVTAIQVDQDNVTLTAIPGLRTVKYWFYPTTATDKEVTFDCTDKTRSIIRVDVSLENQEIYITPVSNGSAMITITAKSGAKAYCKVTVNGIGPKVSYAISYMDNNGVWYYDWSGDFLVKTTAPASEVPGVEVDGVSIPQTMGAQRNWSYAGADGGTAIVFTRQFMASLYHGKHTFAVSYASVGRITRPLYVQSVRDAPRTGDQPIAPLLGMFVLSGVSAVATIAGGIYRRKREHRAKN